MDFSILLFVANERVEIYFKDILDKYFPDKSKPDSEDDFLNDEYRGNSSAKLIINGYHIFFK